MKYLWVTKFFFVNFSDLSTLIHHLETSNYSTLIYVLSSTSIDEAISDERYQISYTSQHKWNDMTGYCDVIASEFSAIYKRNVIFWPCPAMKVSFDSEEDASNIRCS